MTASRENAAPRITRRKPCLVTLESAGKTYFWCACGRSRTQPFCDGSHAGTDLAPLAFKARTDGEEVLLCACKHTKSPPYCDGAHNALGDAYDEASAEEIAQTAGAVLVARDRGGHGRAALDGGAFVFTPAPGEGELRDGWRIAPLVTRASGARRLSLFALEAVSETPAPLAFGEAETALFAAAGAGDVAISDRRFEIRPDTGAFIAPRESFAIRAITEKPLRFYAAICPETAFSRAEGPAAFDGRFPDRARPAERGGRKSMGDRFYQELVDRQSGASALTQFIGEIPRSRAAAHRHLYEEAIVILSGAGFLWTERKRAAVKPGDIIYLPRKQLHSLECVEEAGMRLMGVFFPAGSPAINY